MNIEDIEAAKDLRSGADMWYALAPVPVGAAMSPGCENHPPTFVVVLTLDDVNVDVPRFGTLFQWLMENASAMLYDLADAMDPEHPSRRPPSKERLR